MMTSKYDRLADHLATLGALVITLTFAEVEAVVGPLPAQARHHAHWWGATPAGRYMYTHAMNWWPDLATTSSAWVCFCSGKKTADHAVAPFRRLLVMQGKTTVMFCADDTVYLPTVLQICAG